MKIRAISLWEPYASLIRTGAKRFETRSWKKAYHGPLLICASKDGMRKDQLLGLLDDPSFQAGLSPLLGIPLDLANPRQYGITPKHLSFGRAVAFCILAEYISTDTMGVDPIGSDAPFGDFSPARYAWRLDDVQAILEPFRVTGRQGFFDVEIPSGKLLRDLTPWLQRHAGH